MDNKLKVEDVYMIAEFDNSFESGVNIKVIGVRV